MNNIRDIIYRNINPWTEQRPDATREEIFLEICNNLDSGMSYAVEKDGFVAMFNADNRYLCKIHVFSECKSYKIVSSLKHIISHMFEITEFQKFYGMFENKKLGSLAVKAGWKYEGELTKSCMAQSNEMKSLYIYGIARSDFIKSNINEN